MCCESGSRASYGPARGRKLLPLNLLHPELCTRNELSPALSFSAQPCLRSCLYEGTEDYSQPPQFLPVASTTVSSCCLQYGSNSISQAASSSKHVKRASCYPMTDLVRNTSKDDIAKSLTRHDSLVLSIKQRRQPNGVLLGTMQRAQRSSDVICPTPGAARLPHPANCMLVTRCSRLALQARGLGCINIHTRVQVRRLFQPYHAAVH